MIATAPQTLPKVRVLDGSPMVDWLAKQRAAGVTDEQLAQGLVMRYLDTTEFPLVTESGAAPSHDIHAAAALAQANAALEYLGTRLGRNGWDGRGSDVPVIVHVSDLAGAPAAGASWSPFANRLTIGDGDGIATRTPFAADDDVIPHELGHAVWFHEVAPDGLHRQPTNQHMALTESFADMFAASVDADDWTIGERSVIPGEHQPGYLRDIAKPKYTHMSQLPPGEVEQHDLSGLPSLVGMRFAEQVGRDEMMRVWLRAVDHGMSLAGSFPMFAAATVVAAREELGDQAARFLKAQWNAIGVRPSRPAAQSDMSATR